MDIIVAIILHRNFQYQDLGQLCPDCVLLRVTIAMMKPNDQMKIGKEKFYLADTSTS